MNNSENFDPIKALNANQERLQSELSALGARQSAIENKIEKLIGLYLNSGTENSSSATADKASRASEKPRIPIDTTISGLPPKPDAVMNLSNSSAQKSRINFLPIVATICFVLAGIFMVRMAIDSGWLNQERQWGLTICFSAILVACGLFLPVIEENYRVYLSAAGAVVSFIAAYSGHLYFQVIPAGASILLAAICSGLCLFLQRQHESELFSVITVVGTYLVPILIGADNDVIFHAAYFLVWAALFSSLAIELRSRVLPMTASYFGLGVFAFLNMKNTSDLGLIVCVQSMQFFIFAVGVYRQSSLTKQLLSKAEAAVYLPVLLFFYSTTYYFLNKLSPELAAWISLGFAGGLFAIYHFFKKSFGATNTKDIVEAFLTIVLLHSGYFQLLPDWAKPSLLPLFLLLNLVARNRNAMPTLSKIVKMGFQFVSAIELGKICFALLSTSDHRMSIFAVATVILAYLNYGVLDLDQRKSQLFLVVTNLLAVLMIYNVAYQFGSVAISLGWAAYAFLVLAYGWQQRDKGVIHSSLVIIIMATIKALVFDAITSAPEVRVLSLIVTGVVLYATGWLFKRVSAWE